MAAADLSQLPRAVPVPNGNPPDAPHYSARIAEVLAGWSAQREAEHVARREEEGREDAKFWHSEAGNCSRRIAYRMAGLEATNPMDLAGVWNTTLGTAVHDIVQKAFVEAWPDAAELEVRVTFDDLGSSGRADVVLRLEEGGEPYVVAFELKSVGGFGFKSHVGLGNGDAGPMHTTVLQGALNAKAVDADVLVLMDFAKECISPSYAKKLGHGAQDVQRFSAEWRLPRDVYEPMADAELRRLAKITSIVAAEGPTAVPRFIPNEMPARARVVDPAKGRWELRDEGAVMDAGSSWMCGYCNQKDRCLADHAEGK